MKLKIEITMDNAAFENDTGDEVARILSKLAARLADGPLDNEFKIGLLDYNGNRVGEVKVSK